MCKISLCDSGDNTFSGLMRGASTVSHAGFQVFRAYLAVCDLSAYQFCACLLVILLVHSALSNVKFAGLFFSQTCPWIEKNFDDIAVYVKCESLVVVLLKSDNCVDRFCMMWWIVLLSICCWECIVFFYITEYFSWGWEHSFHMSCHVCAVLGVCTVMDVYCMVADSM